MKGNKVIVRHICNCVSTVNVEKIQGGKREKMRETQTTTHATTTSQHTLTHHATTQIDKQNKRDVGHVVVL